MRLFTLKSGGMSGLLVAAVIFYGLASVAQEQEYVEGEVIVKLKGKGLGAHAQKFLQKMTDQGAEVKASYSGLNIHHLANSNRRTAEMLEDLKSDPTVEYAEPNYIIHKHDFQQTPGEAQMMTAQDITAQSNAPFFLTTTDIMDATPAWTQLTAGIAKPIVAIIDTGVKRTHPALANAIWVNPGETGLDGSGNNKSTNGIDDDGNGFVDDVNGWNFQTGDNNPDDCDGHGTHVAGIVRGMTQDLGTSAGATPLIQIMPVRFLDCTGSGTTSAAISAIYYAINNGAKVLNNSWGGGGYSQALNEAIAATYSVNAIFVAAAGNSSANNDGAPMYPASYDVPNIVSVAATDNSDALAWFSNYGVASVQVAATGNFVYSSYIGANPAGAYYASLSGTSMAAPMVSGLAAMMIHERSTMTGYQVKQLIMSNVTPIAGLVTKVSSHGRINANNSVASAKTATLLTSVPSYSLTLSAGNRGVASALASTGAGCGLVTKLSNGSGGGDGGLNVPALIFVLLLVPIGVTIVLRKMAIPPEARRKFDRYQMTSSVRLKVGGRELEGNVMTISQGGAGISAHGLLENGSVVSMTIQSPDGKEQIQVQGHIVWSDPSQRYGVQFAEAPSALRQTIEKWTRGLIKAS